MMQFEYEAKSLISEEDFNLLLTKYSLNTFIKQENIYFETNNNFFKNMGAALRIRNYNDTQYELTIKIKNDNSNTEYNYKLTQTEFNQIKTTYELPNFDFPFVIPKIDSAVSTITNRYKLDFLNHIVEIDKTLFKSTTDYEIEIESENLSQANEIMRQFLTENQITFKKSLPKIARYFLYNQ